MRDAALWLSAAGTDRAAELRRTPGTLVFALADPATRVLEVDADRVRATDGSLVPRPPEPDDADRSPVLLGRDPGGTLWLAVGATGDDDAAPDQPFEPGRGAGPGMIGLRGLATALPGWQSTLAATGVALQRWHRFSAFCGACGAPTRAEDAGWRRGCTGCGLDHFPRTDPVVIVGVESPDRERFLLTRGVGWKEHRYSCPAGFVDAAESLEDAVRREMLEEVGLRVTDLHLVSNQAWPFNGQLMCAFTARSLDDTIVVDPAELAAAMWVTRDSLAEGWASGVIGLPDRYAAGRWLVERWYGGELPPRA